MKLRQKLHLIRRLLKLQWQTNPDLVAAKLLTGITTALGPLLAVWFSARILEELTGPARRDILVFWAAGAVLFGVLLTALNSVIQHWGNRAAELSWFRTEHIHAKKIMSMDFEDVEDSRVHALLTEIQQNDNYNGLGFNRIIWDLNDAVEGLTSVLVGAGMTAALFFSATVVPGYGWLDHLACVVGVLGLVILSALLTARMQMRQVTSWIRPENVKYMRASNAMYHFLSWHLPVQQKLGMDIRIYSLHQTLARLAESRAQAEQTYFGKCYRDIASCGFVAALGKTVCYGISYLFVALKALGGAFGIGSVVQYVGAISRFSDGVSKLAQSGSVILAAAEYLETTFRFLDIPNKKYMGSLTVEKRCDNKYDVEFRDVSFRYPGSNTYALRHTNLKFQIGRRLAVVGPNGSGKTTMIKLLCRLYDPTEGEILLNGIDIRKYDYDEYMALFSVVFQDFRLFAFTLGENVASAVRYDEARAAECLRLAGFEERLENLPHGLNTFLGQDFDSEGVELSGGEAQKVALARALYKKAPFVVLDEPTAALDPVAEYEIYTKFNEIIGDHTAIYISHRLSSCRFCDEIAVFHNGEVIQFGTHESLLADTAGKYYELWNAQAQYYVES